MNKIQVFDIETFTNFKTFRLIGLYDGVFYRYYTNVDDAITDMEESGGIWYAHNGGKFDDRFLYDYLYSRYKLNFIFRNSRFYKITCYRGKSHKKIFEIRDSYLLLMSSLKSLAIAFNVETLKGEIDYNTSDIPALIAYNKDDCKALYQVLMRLDEMTTTGLALTIASQAQREFKADGGHYDDVIRHYELEPALREAYYGGRVEAFTKVGYSVHLYDINSQYTTAMMNYFPVGRYYKTETYQPNHLGIYFIKWERPEHEKYGIFPTRNIHNALVFSYPSGEGWHCQPEIDRALKRGYKIEVITGVYWKKKRKIFAEVVGEWYKNKSRSKGAIREYYKRLLNSLYGRLGIKEESDEIIPGPLSREQIKAGIWTPLDDDGMFFTTRKYLKFQNVYVQLVAFVTSYARVLLHKLLVNSDALYCDTDSVVSYKDLPSTDDLGGIKLEDTGNYIGIAPKLMCMYEFENHSLQINHLSAKGFNRSQITLDMFLEAKQGYYDNFKTSEFTLLGQKLCMKKGVSFLTTIENVRAFRGSPSKDSFPPRLSDSNIITIQDQN